MTENDFHLLGAWDNSRQEKAACVLIADTRGRVALQLRDDFPGIKRPGYWGFFGGHIEAGESISQAAVREFGEETGIAITESELRPFVRVLTKPQNGVRLFVFKLNRKLQPQDFSVREGAGFAFLTPAQIDDFRVIPSIGMTLRYHFSSKSLD